MKDCKEHYLEMYHVRLGESDCPFCEIQSLKRKLHKVEIAIMSHGGVNGEAAHDLVNIINGAYL